MAAMTGPLRLGFVINFEPSDPPGRWLGTYLPEDRYGTELLAALAPPELDVGATSMAAAICWRVRASGTAASPVGYL